MPRKTRTHVMVDDTIESPRTPKHLTKQQFAQRLYREMVKRSWNQSELARRSGLERDKISVYINAKSLPTPANADKLAAAFGIKSEELLPNFIENAIDEDAPSFEMRVSVSAPNTAWVRVNRLLSMSTAVKIAELLEADDVLTRSGDGGPSRAEQA